MGCLELSPLDLGMADTPGRGVDRMVNDYSLNGVYPLNSVSHEMGAVHRIIRAVSAIDTV